MRRAWTLFRDWASCLAVPWGGYLSLAAFEAPLRMVVPRESLLLAWERSLFRGLSAPERLAPCMTVAPVRWLMIGTYLSFYGALLGVPAVLLLRGDRARFRALRLGLLAAALAGYTLYLALPARSPYYVLPLYDQPAFEASQRLVQGALEGGVAFRYDAFPSMHVAFSVVLAALGGTSPGRWAWLGLLCLSTLATGAHWGVDVLAGGVLGLLAWWAATLAWTRS